MKEYKIHIPAWFLESKRGAVVRHDIWFIGVIERETPKAYLIRQTKRIDPKTGKYVEPFHFGDFSDWYPKSVVTLTPVEGKPIHKAVFLDRDGVINEIKTERVRYVNEADDFYLIDGVADAIAKLRRMGYKIFIATNQAGLCYGYMNEETLEAIHQKMKDELLKQNPKAIIDDIAFCPHDPRDFCPCRKPKPGMILDLAAKYDIDLSQSYMIGDMESDIQAGKAAGCQTFLIDAENSLTDFVAFLDQK